MPITLATDSTSPVIDISLWNSGEIIVPSASTTLTTLTYYIKQGGNYYAAYDSAGSAVTQTVAHDKAYPIPAAVMGAATIQIRGNAAESIGVILKS